MDELKNKPVTPSEEDALESFLNRETQPDMKQKPRRFNRGVLWLIIAVIIVGALVGVYLILSGQPLPQTGEDAYIPAKIEATVDAQGEHQAVVPTDAEGEIAENGSGDLLTYTPADLLQIDVENAGGSFTVTADTSDDGSTSYTLIGFEGFELQSGMAEDVANDAAALAFTDIAATGADPADFGLDQPRATVRIRYTDDSTSTVRVGAAAPASAGTYVSFGDGDAVYLVADDSVDAFLYNVLDLISLDITSAADDSESDQFTSLTITGSRYPDPIILEPNTDEAVNASYLVTAPRRMYASSTESYDIAGSIRDLYAESVVCVNPSDAQLASYGLAEPYAAIEAVYPDATIRLSASAAGEDGAIYLYHPDKRIVYTIQLGAVSWANTSLEALVPDTFLDVKVEAVSAVNLSMSDRSYPITVTTVTDTTENEDGDTEEVKTTTASYNGKDLTEENFMIFFQNLMGVKNMGAVGDTSDQVVLQVQLSYSTGRADDLLQFCATDSAYYAVGLNGEWQGLASKSYIDQLITGADNLVQGNPVSSF